MDGRDGLRRDGRRQPRVRPGAGGLAGILAQAFAEGAVPLLSANATGTLGDGLDAVRPSLAPEGRGRSEGRDLRPDRSRRPALQRRAGDPRSRRRRRGGPRDRRAPRGGRRGRRPPVAPRASRRTPPRGGRRRDRRHPRRARPPRPRATGRRPLALREDGPRSSSPGPTTPTSAASSSTWRAERPLSPATTSSRWTRTSRPSPPSQALVSGLKADIEAAYGDSRLLARGRRGAARPPDPPARHRALPGRPGGQPRRRRVPRRGRDRRRLHEHGLPERGDLEGTPRPGRPLPRRQLRLRRGDGPRIPPRDVPPHRRSPR